MERTRLIARLLSEVATARATIAASYLRLWRSEERSPIDRGHADQGRETQRDPDVSAAREQRCSRDDDG